MRVTSKGQVTIPKAVRDKLGITPGDDIGFREEGAQMVLVNETAGNEIEKRDANLQRAIDLIRQMRADGRIEPLGMSVDEYMNVIRGYDGDADDPGFKRPS
jgi:AbrB family looped-hinge helix DNA binding protein